MAGAPSAAATGEQVLAAAKVKEETKARNIWLHAWHDPVAGLKAYSQCVRLADLNGDGESKLMVAGSDKKLKIYKGTTLLSENVLLDQPVAVCIFYPDANKPRTPSVAVAAGPFVFIYRNLRPYYKFSLPALVVDDKEADVWTRLFELNRSLASKKPHGLTVRDWRNRLDRWRTERRTLAHADIDSDNDHIWMMRVLESVSQESWYKKLRKDIAHDERRGMFIDSTDAMWEKFEFEETWLEDNPSHTRVNNVDVIEDYDMQSQLDETRGRSNRFHRDYEVAALGRGRGRRVS